MKVIGIFLVFVTVIGLALAFGALFGKIFIALWNFLG